MLQEYKWRKEAVNVSMGINLRKWRAGSVSTMLAPQAWGPEFEALVPT